MRVIGVDPGQTGAIASWDGSSLIVFDVPTLTVAKSSGKGKRTEVNLPELVDNLNILFAGSDHAYIERVGAMPGQGVTSTFNFGMAYGYLRMGIAMIGVPSTLVAPVKWKSELGLSNDGEKSRHRALELFPKFSSYFSRKMDHNRAEAALLAYYGRQMLTVGKVR